MTDRRAWTLAGAVAVVVAVVAVVAVFAVRPYPALPALAEQPDPPVDGRLATVEYDHPGDPCLVVVDGDGTRREVICGRFVGGELRWVDDDRVAVGGPTPPGEEDQLDVIDVDSGEVVDRIPRPADPPPGLRRERADGARLRVEGADGTTSVTVDGDVVVQLDGPETYALVDAGWTADGRWIAVQDSIGRVLAVDATGAVGPRIWAEDVGVVVVR